MTEIKAGDLVVFTKAYIDSHGEGGVVSPTATGIVEEILVIKGQDKRRAIMMGKKPQDKVQYIVSWEAPDGKLQRWSVRRSNIKIAR